VRQTAGTNLTVTWRFTNAKGIPVGLSVIWQQTTKSAILPLPIWIILNGSVSVRANPDGTVQSLEESHRRGLLGKVSSGSYPYCVWSRCIPVIDTVSGEWGHWAVVLIRLLLEPANIKFRASFVAERYHFHYPYPSALLWWARVRVCFTKVSLLEVAETPSSTGAGDQVHSSGHHFVGICRNLLHKILNIGWCTNDRAASIYGRKALRGLVSRLEHSSRWKEIIPMSERFCMNQL
jgi:hypothetical protein